MEHPDPDLLLAHAGWMRTLARELAGPGGADDLLQETWMAALRRPGGEHNLGAWLAGVVRHLARRAQRSESSRPRREHAAARAEAQPATDELVAEGELQRRLMEAVMALAEPYRSTVLLRYFRGASCEEIARQQAVPSATVRTRLARALAKLREALDRSAGGREAWSAVALSLSPSGGSGVFAQVALTGAKAKLGWCAALACALAGAVVWQAKTNEGVAEEVRTASSESAEAGPAIRSTPDELTAPPRVETDEPAPARESVPLAADTATPGALAYGLFASGGKDVEDGWVRLVDEGGREFAQTDVGQGSWAIDGLHPGRWTLRAGGAGCAELEEELHVPEGAHTVHHDVELERGLVLRVRVLDQFGQSLTPRQARIGLIATQEPLPADALCTPEAFTALGTGRWELTNSEPSPRLTQGLFGLLRLSSLPVFLHVTSFDALLETRLVTSAADEIVFRIDTTEIERGLGGLRARFVDSQSGRPVATGGAQLLQQWTGTLHSSVSALDPHGVIVFEHKPAGPQWLCFRDESSIRPPLAVRVAPGTVTDIGDVRVWSRATLRGEFVDEQGELTGVDYAWTVLDELRGPLDCPSNESRKAGGRFEIENVARAPLWLTLRAKDYTQFGLAVDASAGAVDGLVIRVPKGVPVTFQHERASFGRLVTVADALGRPLATWTLGLRPLATRLAPGRYQLWTSLAERIERRVDFAVGREPLELVVPPPER